jgi:NTE family protein
MRRRFAVVGSAHPRYLPYCRLEEVAIPLHVVCAKFSTGAEAVLSQGPIIEAVLASTAIPGVFPPVSARPLARMTHAITLMGARQLRHEFERYAPSVSVHIVPPPCPQSQSSYDYSAAAHLIARARESTRRWIDDHGLEKCEFPVQLSIHSH